MVRSFTTMLVAFAVTLFALNPAIDAQWPTVQQQQQSQPPQPAPQYPGADQNAGQDPNQAPPPQNEQQEAAADQKHGISRISVVQGDVNVRRADGADLTAAVINAPLASQDHLQTGDGSRAEIEFDSANLLRLAPNSDVGLADLEYRRYQIQVGVGTVMYRVLRASDAQVEVDTPSVGFRPLGEGEFRISVLDDGTSEITARSGEAEIFGPRGSQRVPQGQTVLVRGNPSDPEFQNTGEVAPDQFDAWSNQRDSELSSSQAYRYVSPDVGGAEDLDRYGNWVPSEYGQVWAPQSEPSDWSPYSTGQWTWQGYYGWTWVDAAPWGWAPYHYGRWFRNGGYGWCWYPGGPRASFGWSPAVVGFFGWGGFGVGVGLGGLGWVALAPFEGFHRWWGSGFYGRGYGGPGWYGRGGYGNFARNVDITRVYRNAAFRGGAITAGYNNFGGPHQHFVAANRGQLTNANSFRGGQLPLTPNRASMQFSNRAVAANPRLSSASNRQFFQSSRFSSGQSNVNRSVGANGYSGANRYSGLSNTSRPAAQANRPSSSSGWQRFGDPGRSSGALRQGFTGSSGSEPSGWHSFGQPQRSTPSAPRSYTPSSPSGSRFGAPTYNAPRYSAPAQNYRAPQYSAPRQTAAPTYNAPRSNPGNSAPHYSAPSRSPSGSGGGNHGGGGASSGGGHNSGGGGGHNSGGGGGHHR